MTWFYAPGNGALVHEDPPNPQYYDLELGTVAGQWKVVNVNPDATTEQAAAAANKQFGPGTKTNGQTAQTSNTSDSSVAGKAAENAVPGVSSITQFLSQPGLWIRLGEVAAGLILLGIGLNAMLKGRPLQVVTGTAGKVGKVAML